MKRIWMIFLLAGIVRGADVTAWISGDLVLANDVRWSATQQAVRMFGAIGVSLEWVKALPAASQGVAIEVRFTTNVPTVKPRVLAFSTPFSPKPVVTVLWDEIASITTNNRGYRAMLLAHVLVHEMGHVLMGTNLHSDQGVMKASWTLGDHGRMARRSLSFLPADAQAIRDGIASFAAHRVPRVESDVAPGPTALPEHGDEAAELGRGHMNGVSDRKQDKN